MTNKEIFYCTTCATHLKAFENKLSCLVCKKEFPIEHGVPLFSEDRYWGKIPELEIKDIIHKITKDGFSAFSSEMQKKLDFTYDEDRADWRFFVPLTKESVVLDIGAGLGRVTIPLARVAKKVIACDQSVSRVIFLQKRAESLQLNNVDVFVGDVFNLPLEENSVDLIVLNGVLEWVGLTDLYKDPYVAQVKCLEMCMKLLKKGGYLYIGIENRYAMAYTHAPDHGGLRYTSYIPRYFANLYSKLRGKGPYRTYTYSKKGYEHLIHKAGFIFDPDFYLLYPGYNLPRIVIPYENLNMLKFIISRFKQPKNKLKRVFTLLIKLPGALRLYRFLFYSFGIIVKK